MTPANSTLTLGDAPLSIEDLVHIAEDESQVSLSKSSAFKEKIDSSFNFLHGQLKSGFEIYGVTTGYGDSCTTSIDKELVAELPLFLTRYHQCGMGKVFSPTETRAIQTSRLASLLRGKSGVSLGLLEQIISQLNHKITPRIPQEGSVGASGDLTPLAYLAATLVGESQVWYDGQFHETMSVYKKLSINPIKLKPKEGLAVMNGTAVMTALACIAFDKAQYLCKYFSRLTALTSLAIKGNKSHFAKPLFDAKPHPGQAQIAHYIREDIKSQSQNKPKSLSRLQDRYSIRCAPHVIGVLQDSLPFFRQLIETELNSANDNPIIDPDSEQILHGGNFYGGHIGFVMDSMKNLVANIADLADRQVALLIDPKFSNGLPANLSGAGKYKNICHGFKALQISISAWTAEALKNTMPASVFSRSTEAHNQDKVSMGTISARDCLRIIELTQQVAAATTLISAQALQIRLINKELSESDFSNRVANFKNDIFENFKFLENDRPLEADLHKFVSFIDNKKWQLYPDT